MTAAGAAHADASAFRPFHLRLMLLTSLAFFGNGIDASVMSFALPGMTREWRLTPADVAFVLPMLGLGQLVGAIVVGSLVDRIGRKLSFALTSTLAGVGIGLSALSTGPLMLALLVFMGGIGFGGVAPAAGAIISEFAPPSYRGRMLAWTQIFWVMGWSLAATMGGWFEQVLGWRGILALGGLPIVFGLLSWLTVPESPRYLLSRGRRADAEAIADTLRRRHDVVIPLDYAPPERRTGSLLRSVASLWSPAYWRRTFALWTTWTAMNAAFAGPIVWLPFVLQNNGATQPLQLSAFAGYAMLPGGLLALFLIDRFGRRPLMLASLGIAAAGGLLMALSRDPVLITIGGAALAGGALAAWPVALGWSSEQYPTRLRGTAAGWASGVARLGSIGAPVLIGRVIGPTGEGHVAALLPFSLLLLASVVSVGVFARETANRTVEELSEPA